MRQALHAEWTKLRTTPGPGVLLLSVVVLTVALSTAVVAAISYAAGDATDATKLSLTGVQLGQAVVAVLAVFVIGGEYGTGMIRTTLAAMPRRHTMLAAKATILTGAVVGAGIAAALGSLLVGRLILPGNGFTATRGYPLLTLADGPTLRAVTGSVLYLVLIALLALGIGTAVRDSATAIGIVLALLYLFPIIATAVNPHWHRRLDQIAPMTAGLYIQATKGVRDLPLTPWQGLGVLAVWAVGALVGGGLLLQLRDA
jgi:ABC-2 type transport system permease protein